MIKQTTAKEGKKPSERIKEIVLNTPLTEDHNSDNRRTKKIEDYLKAIVQYLDEAHDEQK